MRVVILGLSITSSWGNGHATTYRGLVRELEARGHESLFLERDVPWYAAHRDLPAPPYGRTELYRDLDELFERHDRSVRDADLVIVGSYVPDGVRLGTWVCDRAEGVRAFYDIDTPVTLAKLERGDTDYLSTELVPRYDLYLSFTGGPTLERLEREFGAPMARALHCSFDPRHYRPEDRPARWDLGYMGTYSADRQPGLERLLLEPARRQGARPFVVAGPGYPEEVAWPGNVDRIDHLPPARHREFYTSQRITLNLTREDMVRAGWSPSVRLFEAAACAVPVISDWWEGLDAFFEPDREILVAETTDDVLRFLTDLPRSRLREIGRRARERAVREHSAARRVRELEGYAGAARHAREAAA